MAKRASRYISKQIKDEVRKRDRERCVECGATDYLEFDHITPYSKGAPNVVDNIQLLCRKCNLKKGSKTPQCVNCKSWIINNASYCQSCGDKQPQKRKSQSQGSQSSAYSILRARSFSFLEKVEKER
jgi:hypothetical protein